MVNHSQLWRSVVTTALRAMLAKDLIDAVEAHHLVVWQDDTGAFSDIASQVVPAECRFARFDGSWVALRRAVENELSKSEPPRLVVYINAPAPSLDLLEELRSAASTYEETLAAVIRRGLAGELPDSRVAEIASQSKTFTEAEVAAGVGASQGSVVLTSVLNTGGDVEQLLAVLSGEQDATLDSRRAWPEVHALFGRLLGIGAADVGVAFRISVAKALLIGSVQLAEALPERLHAAIDDCTPPQRVLRVRILDDWWLRHPAAAFAAFTAADEDIRVGDEASWVQALENVSLGPSLERAALAAALHKVKAGSPQYAADLATGRRRGRWVRESAQVSGGGGWAVRWTAVAALAELCMCLADEVPPTNALPNQILRWYVDRGWRVDRAHRRFELALAGLDIYDALDEPVAAARLAYDNWLSTVIQRFTSAVGKEGLALSGALRQGEIHDRFVNGSDGLVAYVWVDAMRFELAIDVAEAIRSNGHSVELHGAIAAIPTITQVGMANLCPGASTSLTLDEAESKLVVRVAGTDVKTVEDRRTLLRGAHGQVADVELSSWMTRSEKELASRVAGADMILIRSQELDATGENGIEMLSAAWSTFAETQGALTRMVAKLAALGVSRVVITADHGFIALSRRLDDSMRIDAPKGGKGELHRRCWVGRGATDHASVLRMPVALAGIGGDVDVLVPRGLAVFAAGGSKQFFHGGLSPQELVVPVIVADLVPAKSKAKTDVDIDIVGGKITTSVFAASLTFAGDLFTSEVVVRVIARRGPDQEVAQIADGDGYSPERGTITVAAGSEARLVFKITRPLEPNDRVELQVFDARTDLLLATAPATVAVPVRTMEDELD
jgi:hypothetical protein